MPRYSNGKLSVNRECLSLPPLLKTIICRLETMMKKEPHILKPDKVKMDVFAEWDVLNNKVVFSSKITLKLDNRIGVFRKGLNIMYQYSDTYDLITWNQVYRRKAYDKLEPNKLESRTLKFKLSRGATRDSNVRYNRYCSNRTVDDIVYLLELDDLISKGRYKDV